MNSLIMSFGGQYVEVETQAPAEPIWLTLTLQEIDDVRRQVEFAWQNLGNFSEAWEKAFITSIKEKLDSGDLRLSFRQHERIVEIATKVASQAGNPTNMAIVAAAMDVFEDELSQVEFELRELQRRRKDVFQKTRQQIANATDKIKVHDFAERLVKTYWRFPNAKVQELISLFGDAARGMQDIPPRYLKAFSSGVVCKFCGKDIRLGPRREHGRSAVIHATCPQCHKMKMHGATLQSDGTVAVHKRGTLAETYDSVDAYQKQLQHQREAPPASAQDSGGFSPVRQRELSELSYVEYLQTPEWDGIRRAALARAGYMCQTCAAKGKLHVHHNKYPPRGTETKLDVCVLCVPCHHKFHGVAEVEPIETRKPASKARKGGAERELYPLKDRCTSARRSRVRAAAADASVALQQSKSDK